jgi:hypothetical protein
MFGSSQPRRGHREELAGVRRSRHIGGRKQCTAGERGSNLCNSVQRLHVPCPSDPFFVRKLTNDATVINPPPDIVNGRRMPFRLRVGAI